MRALIIFSLLVLMSADAFAELPIYCQERLFSKAASESYPESVKGAKAALKGLCKALDKNYQITADELNTLFVEFHYALETEANFKIPELMPYLTFFGRPLFEYQDAQATVMISTLKFVIDPNNSSNGYIRVRATGSQNKNYDLKMPQEVSIACYKNSDCNSRVRLYEEILRVTYNPFRVRPVALSQGFITAKDQEWKKFIEQSRSQTFIDIALTSFFMKPVMEIVSMIFNRHLRCSGLHYIRQSLLKM